MLQLKSFTSNFNSLKTWRALVVFSLLFLIISKPYNQKNGFKVIEWDVTLYYTYLPALFIHQDLKFEKEWTSKLASHQLGFGRDDEGNRYLKMTSGMAMMYAPFFALAHGLTTVFSPELATGYSQPYRVALSFGSWLYIMFGLWVLRKVLLRFYSDATVGWTLAIVLLGTNLFHYTVWRGAMSHGYSFTLASLLAYFVFRYKDNPKFRYAIAMGLISGLLVLIRPVNVLMPLFLGVYLLIDFLRTHRKIYGLHIVLILLFGFIAILPQLLIWHYQTGNWIVYSYSEEGFFFTDPQILNGLFSYRKGWLLYSPLILLSILGLGYLFQKDKSLTMTLGMMTVSVVYVTYSWWCWWYGGSFGSRPMIDYYALLAIPLAAFVEKVLNMELKKRRAALIVIAAFISISVFQNYQYQRGIIHYDSMSQETYWKVFMKSYHPKGFDESLDPPDYAKALKGE